MIDIDAIQVVLNGPSTLQNVGGGSIGAISGRYLKRHQKTAHRLPVSVMEMEERRVKRR